MYFCWICSYEMYFIQRHNYFEPLQNDRYLDKHGRPKEERLSTVAMIRNHCIWSTSVPWEIIRRDMENFLISLKWSEKYNLYIPQISLHLYNSDNAEQLNTFLLGVSRLKYKKNSCNYISVVFKKTDSGFTLGRSIVSKNEIKTLLHFIRYIFVG